MSTVATTRNAAALDAVRLSFSGLVRSEWIKLRTVRSTVWCYTLIVVLTVGFGFLFAGTMPKDMGAGAADNARQMTILVSTASVNFSQLIAVVLGVLVIAGEYRTGMIRSTLTAAPKRTGAYVAKALVLAATTFVVAAISVGATAALTAPLLTARGIAPALFGHATVLPSLLGAAVYLTLIAVLAFTLGTIVRNTAGGIACIVAVVLVLPTVLQILMGVVHDPVWVENIAALLPAAAGSHLYAYIPPGTWHGQPGEIMLNAWGGLAVLCGWVVVLGGIGLGVLKRRDA